MRNKLPNQTSKSTGVDIVKIASITACVVIIIATFVFFGFTESLRSKTEYDDATESPLWAQLPLIFGFIGVVMTTFIGNLVSIKNLSKKVETVEKQTNGRTHVRDAQIDALVQALGLQLKDAMFDKKEQVSLNTPSENDTPPEEAYCPEQEQLQQEMIRISKRMSELREEGK